MQVTSTEGATPRIAVLCTALDGRVLSWPPEAEALYGIPAAAALNEPLDALLTVDGVRCSEHAGYRELARHGSWEGTVRHRARGGREAAVRWSLSRVPAPGGEGELVVGVATTLPARPPAEDTLRASEQKTRSILRAAPIGIGFVVDRVLLEVNDELCRMVGFSAAELLGQSARMIYPSDEDFEFVGQEKYRQIAARGSGTVETRWRRKSGEIINVLLSSTPLDPANLAEGVTFTALDITERKQNEQALLESERLNRMIVEMASDYIFHLDVDAAGRAEMDYVSQSFVEITGRTLEQVASVDSWSEFLHPDDLPQVAAAMHAVIAERRAVEIECRASTTAGLRWTLVYARPELDARGERVVGIIGAVKDISERKRMEEEQDRLRHQLQQALKMEAIGRLAGGLAHDFNNLLTGILGNADLALMDLDDSDPLADTLREVTRAANSAAALTSQLLAFSRKQMIEPRVILLNDLVRNLQPMLARLIGEDVELCVALAADLVAVKVDPGQFEQVLVNLAVNSRDAMPAGGRLVIETSNVELGEEYCASHAAIAPGLYAMLAVSDTGEGMSEEALAHLFEPFFTTKPQGQGTGLGLATTYGTVKQAGGTIEVYSEPGRGTTFKIYLPRVGEKAARWEPGSRSEALPGGAETVLLVEDEAVVRDLAERILSRLGYQVFAVQNGGEALLLAEARSERIDLLFTDVVMPRMSGRELASRLAALHPEMKVLFTSGYTENAVVHNGEVEAAPAFLGKPYTAGVLARKVREVLDGGS